MVTVLALATMKLAILWWTWPNRVLLTSWTSKNWLVTSSVRLLTQNTWFCCLAGLPSLANEDNNSRTSGQEEAGLTVRATSLSFPLSWVPSSKKDGSLAFVCLKNLVNSKLNHASWHSIPLPVWVNSGQPCICCPNHNLQDSFCHLGGSVMETSAQLRV